MNEKPGFRDFAELNDQLCRLFTFRDRVQRKCANLGEMECRLLNLLAGFSEPVGMNSLAEALQVSHSRVTRLVDSLVKKGLVQRTQSQLDRRSWLVQLSGTGDDATRHVATESREIQEALISRLPEKELTTILRHVQHYVEAYRQVLQEKDQQYAGQEQLTAWQHRTGSSDGQ
jgi:DNA-binding MarR family transcriptional regulator